MMLHKILLASCLSLVMAVSSFAADTEKKTVVISDADWPPFFFAGRSWTREGIGKEILKYCVPQQGFNADFVFLPIKRMAHSIENGLLDINVYAYKPEREAFVLYGKEPVFESGYRAFALQALQRNVASIEDFKGLTIGHLRGLQYMPEYLALVDSERGQNRLFESNRDEWLLEALLKGQIDVFVGSETSVIWQARQKGWLSELKPLDYGIPKRAYFVTLSKKSTVVDDKQSFLDGIDACIKDMKRNGQYDKIISRYIDYTEIIGVD